MATKKFAVKHNLDQLSKDELVQYLRDVSEFIGLDPDLNGLDTIWMNNETGSGRSLVVYARRGTAEILRNIYGVEVESLTYAEVNGSMVFTATGRAKARENRQEIAIGSKSVRGLSGKELDDSIMTASTRALRRLTMQFTTLGILDESEVVALLGHAPNPAGSVQLAANPQPPIFSTPIVPANNAPGKAVETKQEPVGEPFVGQQTQIDAAMAQVTEKKAAEKAAPEPTPAPATPVESTTSEEEKVAEKAARKPRKPRNQVNLEVEPEVVQTSKTETKSETKPETIPAPPPQPAPEPQSVPTQANPVVPTQANPAPLTVLVLPTAEQMNEYKTKIGAFTAQLPASEGMTPQQKMRAFITSQSGVVPQNMTVAQWDEILSWFPQFVETNGVKGLIKYINDTLGVK